MAAELNAFALLDLMEAGQTVLLPNAHAVRSWRARFDARQRARGRKVWEPPPLFTWTAWTSSLWTNLVLDGIEERILLNRVQEEAIWAEIVRSSPQRTELAPSVSQDLAQLARTGFGLAAAYHALDRLHFGADSSDTRTFADWADAFRDHCTHHRLLPSALLEHTLARHVRTRAHPVPGPIHLVEVAQHTPAMSELIGALRAVGAPVRSYTLVYSGPHPTARLSAIAPDPTQELQLGVGWIAAELRLHPESTVALVATDLDVLRPQLDRLLRQHLAPELESVGADLSSKPWQFSTEPALVSLPVVAHALQMLRWATGPLPLEAIGQLLLSPFFDYADSLETRARFDLHSLRRFPSLIPELDMPGFLHLTQRFPVRRDGASPSFPGLRSLSRMAEQKGLNKASRSHADWVDLVRNVLHAAGWPGPRELSPAEFQALEAWESLLDLLATLDLDGRKLTFPALLQKLEREATNLRLTPSSAIATVQIMSLEESAGTLFDRALVLGATDANLPRLQRSHPLLGSRLQASLGMPGTDPALAYAESHTALQRFALRAGQTLLTAPARDESGALRLTSLAHELGFEPAGPTQLPALKQPAEPVHLTPVADSMPVPALPSPAVDGGARVLELQAACGFRAFATLRLGADTPETRRLGTDPRENGNLLHRALELFWKHIQSQSALKALSPGERDALIVETATAALSRVRSQTDPQDTWTRAYLRVLELRLRRLLASWLAFELQRGPFTVLAPEQKQQLSIGPLQLSVRPDRIDKVEGGLAFIDYKTSYSLSKDDWLGERLKAPQLPLYVLLAEPEEVRGLAFARIRPGRPMGWISLSDTGEIFPNKKDNKPHPISDQIELWRLELDRLAHAFARGDAQVDPKLYPETCRYCGHRLLCRLNPTTLLAQSTEDLIAAQEVDG